jgi:hypothetical protein
MSDRTQSSVRTGARSGDAAPTGSTAAEPSVSTTQAIPTTGAQRAQTPAAGAPPVPPPSGTPTGAVPANPAPAEAAIGGLTGTTAAATETVGSRSGRGRGPARAGGRGPRRARLQLRHVDTWSALKISLVLSIALFFIWMVAVGILYMVLNGLGVFDTLNDLFGQVGSVSGSKAAASKVITPGVVFGGAAVIGAINIVLMTALCTVGTFIYNLCSDLVGGLEITLSERD